MMFDHTNLIYKFLVEVSVFSTDAGLNGIHQPMVGVYDMVVFHRGNNVMLFPSQYERDASFDSIGLEEPTIRS